MTLAKAARALHPLVKGKFRGIRVTKRGVSPRVVYAKVVGSRGTAAVTGPQLEALFSLPSTYMQFTSISSTKVRRPAPPMAALERFYPGALHAALDRKVMLSGFVFPARKGSIVTIQRRTRKGWRTAQRLRANATGSYTMELSGAGSYRVLYDGVAGPTVTSS